MRQSGGKVLVHCEAGISRSPTICMAYIMRTQRLRLDAAFDVVRQRRHVVSPNFSFLGQLQQFESEVVSAAPEPPHPATSSSCSPPESASFFASDLNFEPPPAVTPLGLSATSSCLQAPLHHQLTLSPITALP